MSPKTINLDETLHEYMLSVAGRESEPLGRLREETAERSDSNMMTAPEQGQLLHLLAGLCGARRTLEVGTYTGYSALWVASALPEDGQLIACDVDAETVDVGRPYWEQAGVADRIEVHIRPALETLDALIDGGEAGAFDLAYIDADKSNYVDYYERCLELLGAGGLIAVDNTLWSGRVADPGDDSDTTRAIRRFNEHLTGDARVDLSLVPIGDGLTLARKRS